MIIGYARVSTDGQTLDVQQAALREAGATRVFSEKISGAKTDRQQLANAIAALAEGDTLIVTKLDRLARSTRDLLNTLDAISKAGASFKSLGDHWADTTTPHGRLMLTVSALGLGIWFVQPLPLAMALSFQRWGISIPPSPSPINSRASGDSGTAWA